MNKIMCHVNYSHLTLTEPMSVSMAVTHFIEPVETAISKQQLFVEISVTGGKVKMIREFQQTGNSPNSETTVTR